MKLILFINTLSSTHLCTKVIIPNSQAFKDSVGKPPNVRLLSQYSEFTTGGKRKINIKLKLLIKEQNSNTLNKF